MEEAMGAIVEVAAASATIAGTTIDGTTIAGTTLVTILRIFLIPSTALLSKLEVKVTRMVEDSNCYLA
jgi:hypothetical protein